MKDRTEDVYDNLSGSDKSIAASLVAISLQIEILYGRTMSLKTVTNDDRGLIAFWDKNNLIVRNSSTGKELFQVNRDFSERIERVFFEEDKVGMIVYHCTVNQEELVHYCSAPSIYKIDQETRDNYRVLYFDGNGALAKEIGLADLREFHDHKRRSVEYPKIVSMNGTLIGREETDESLTFEDFATKSRQSYPDSPSLESNNRFLVTPDFRCFSLKEGQVKECTIPKPWSAVKLFGTYLAVTRPTKEVNVVNLESGKLEFAEQTEDLPKGICGFRYTKAGEAFLAVQYDKYIKIWTRTQAW